MARVLAVGSALCAGLCAVAQADPGDDAGGLHGLQIHGFISQGFLKSTDNDYLVRSSQGSFDFSEAGVNLTTQLTDKLRVGVQFFAFNLGDIGKFNVKADWFYLDYRLRDWLGMRAGRLKIPYGLYNDVSDIDAARAPALLPSSIYPFTNRDFLLAQTGVELYGYAPMNRAGALDYRIYGGSVPLDLPPQDTAVIPLTGLRVPYIAGLRLLWETPFDGLRLGVTGVYLRVVATASFPPPMPLTATLNEYAGVASIEYAAHDLLLAAEYGQTRVSTHYDPLLVPDATISSEGGYVLSAYRLKRWLQPAAFYSLLYPNRDLRDGRQNVQHDLAGTLRFDVNDYWIIKLEAHYMHGTASLMGAADARAAMPADWGLFVVKTTAYF